MLVGKALGRSSNSSVRHCPPFFHHNLAACLSVWLVQALLVLNTPQTVGVTHWKLIDNEIIPETPNLDTPSEAEAEEMSQQDQGFVMSQHSTSDPEFSMLIRYSTRNSGGGNSAPNRGGSSHGIFKRQGVSPPDSSCSRPGREEGGGREAGSKCSGGGAGTNTVKRKVENVSRQPRNPDGSGPMSESDMAGAQPNPLTCGEPVEYMVYDFLKGIARRNEHKSFPEPEVAMIFKKSDTDSTVDLFDVEMGLRKAYQENPSSLTVLNQVGNFWRIKGNTQYAIECFRKALHISADHPDLLLNLARVLFNLKFYDDAVFLAKRSLHMKSSDSHAWLQYFTLGEVYKALEKYEEAAFYFRKSLQKNPSLHVAEMHLKELGLDQHHSVNVYTVLIILVLVAVVLFLIYYLVCAMSA